MKVLFTKNNSVLSRFIRWAFNEPCSHVAIMFPKEKMVFHSNLLGVHLEWADRFLKSNELVYTVDPMIEIDSPEEVDAFYYAVAGYDGKLYDWKAGLYLLWRVMLKKIFGWKLPSKNVWAEKEKYLCGSLLQSVQAILRLPEELDLEMASPYQIYLILAGTEWMKSDGFA